MALFISCHKIYIFIISSLRHWQGSMTCQCCSRPCWIASCSVQKVWERENKERYWRRGCTKRFLLVTEALCYSAQMKTITLTWMSRQSVFLLSYSLFYGRNLCLKLTPVQSFNISGQKITQTEPLNNNCENKRATELAESQGQLQSLIKQGIMGLYGDYHYRPLYEPSTNIFCPPELMLNDSWRITCGRRTWGRIH